MLTHCSKCILAYQYHSMADTDWGWRKRGAVSDEDDHERPNGLYHNYLRKKARGYKHRPYYGYLVLNIKYCNLMFIINIVIMFVYR